MPSRSCALLREQGERFDTGHPRPAGLHQAPQGREGGPQAYQRLNRLGIELLEPGGLLVTSSCSFHMGRDDLPAHRPAGRPAAPGIGLQLLESGQQGPDHPVHPAIPETAYLKTLFLRVLPGF